MHPHDDPHDPNPDDPTAPETWRRLRMAFTPAQRAFWNHAVHERDERLMAGAAWNGLRWVESEILDELTDEIGRAQTIAGEKEARALRAVFTAICRIRNDRARIESRRLQLLPPPAEQKRMAL